MHDRVNIVANIGSFRCGWHSEHTLAIPPNLACAHAASSNSFMSMASLALGLLRRNMCFIIYVNKMKCKCNHNHPVCIFIFSRTYFSIVNTATAHRADQIPNVFVCLFFSFGMIIRLLRLTTMATVAVATVTATAPMSCIFSLCSILIAHCFLANARDQ